MRKFLKKYYIQLVIIAVFFLLMILIVIESLSVVKMIEEKSAELKAIELDRVLAAEFLQNVHVFKRNASYIDQNIGSLDVLLPNNDDEKIQLFSELEKIGRDTGNKSVTLAVNKTSTNDGTAKRDSSRLDDLRAEKSAEEIISIRITVVGSYNDLVNYIHKLENMQYFSAIMSLDLVRTEDDSFKYAKERGQEIDEATLRTDLIQTDMDVNFFLDNE